MTPEEITIPLVVGAVGTLVTSIATRAAWSASVKRWVALIVVAVLTVAVGVFTLRPDAWQTIAVWLAFAVSAMQVVYAALKPSGLFDWLQGVTTPSTTGGASATITVSDMQATQAAFEDETVDVDPTGALTDTE